MVSWRAEKRGVERGFTLNGNQKEPGESILRLCGAENKAGGVGPKKNSKDRGGST